MNPNSDFSDAKVGDLVTSLRHGHGVIVEVLDGFGYTIQASFGYGIDEQLDLFMMDGYLLDTDFAPTLFKGHIDINSLSINYNTI